MTLRLDPHLPLVWRSPFGVQVGIDPVVARIDDVSLAQERMLQALTVGISEPGLVLAAGGHRAEAEKERDDLLARIAPALHTPTQRTPGTVALTGSPALATAIGTLLGSAGIQVLIAESPEHLEQHHVDLAVAIGHFVLPPAVHAHWLRRDIPHLGVTVGDSAVTIGPLVRPGAGPCLLCLELHHRDADPAWPAIASQLLGRASTIETPVLVAETAAATSRIVEKALQNPERPSDRRSLRISATTGHRSTREWVAHPDCGCRGIPELAQGGSRSGEFGQEATR